MDEKKVERALLVMDALMIFYEVIRPLIDKEDALIISKIIVKYGFDNCNKQSPDN